MKKEFDADCFFKEYHARYNPWYLSLQDTVTHAIDVGVDSTDEIEIAWLEDTAKKYIKSKNKQYIKDITSGLRLNYWPKCLKSISSPHWKW